MNRIRAKLRSRRGASISFALLLFLVCAAVGSVVLTAGTAAAGRIASMAETDQQYYAVTSAAEMIRKMVDGQSVTVTEVTTDTVTTPYTDGVAGTASESKTVKTYMSVNDTNPDLSAAAPITSASFSSFTEYAAAMLTGIKSKEAEGEITAIVAAGLDDTQKTFSLAVSGTDISDDEKTALAVDIVETVSADGRLTFSIGKTDGYTLKLVFSAGKIGPISSTDSSGGEQENTGQTVGVDGVVTTTYDITTTTTTAVATTYTWSLDEIETVTATPATPTPAPGG